MFDVEVAYRTAEAIEEFVTSDPDLKGFRIAAAELVENARRVAHGDLAIGPLRNPTTDDLPDRRRAQCVVQLVGLMPAPDGSETPELFRAAAQLHGNVVEAVMHAVFSKYSELVRDSG